MAIIDILPCRHPSKSSHFNFDQDVASHDVVQNWLMLRILQLVARANRKGARLLFLAAPDACAPFYHLCDKVEVFRDGLPDVHRVSIGGVPHCFCVDIVHPSPRNDTVAGRKGRLVGTLMQAKACLQNPGNPVEEMKAIDAACVENARKISELATGDPSTHASVPVYLSPRFSS